MTTTTFSSPTTDSEQGAQPHRPLFHTDPSCISSYIPSYIPSYSIEPYHFIHSNDLVLFIFDNEL